MKAKLDFYLVRDEEGIPNRAHWAVRMYGDLNDTEENVTDGFGNMNQALSGCMKNLRKVGFSHDATKETYPCLEADEM